ncbi:hypothetical protein HMPREF0880_01197 [Yokenella regensburgei ATCC 43003]|nr:hypothetical protein HMPREF0880_01197 [Yokenella regensburgei ATCC 43003]
MRQRKKFHSAWLDVYAKESIVNTGTLAVPLNNNTAGFGSFLESFS